MLIDTPGARYARKYKLKYPERVKANGDHFNKLIVRCNVCNCEVLYTHKRRHNGSKKHIANAENIANENNI
jgi:hypothetical protein